MHFYEANEFHIHRESFEERAYNNFRYNFKTIRQAHHLTLADMADILCLRSRSTLSELENGNHKKMLAMDSMMQLSKVFAVSLDWLFGYTTNPYCEPQIMDIEEALLDIYTRYDPLGYMEIHDAEDIEIWLPNAYLDYQTRKKTYSLPVRANICFLFHCVMLNELYDLLPSSLRTERLERNLTEKQIAYVNEQKLMYESCIFNLVRGTEINDIYKYKRGCYFTDLQQTYINEQSLTRLLQGKENAVAVFDITKEAD
ncbi:helix-turn-helix domain-containing protein [uncultured Phascolarctobacterium sp.]|uniref:helix-turn-helix domain-containing protein n=1 Tax=uncultured Phascolarctobacterium sp. TaxID=512296 RepID=UPI0025E29431|nr:helix-turn-helix transcriptional regulator [uncultured Phascolarctobacterium sp.]